MICLIKTIYIEASELSGAFLFASMAESVDALHLGCSVLKRESSSLSGSTDRYGEIGRHEGLKIPSLLGYRFDPGYRYNTVRCASGQKQLVLKTCLS